MRIGLISVLCFSAWCQAEWKSIPLPRFDSTAKEPVWSVVAHNGALWATNPHGLSTSRDSGRTWQSVRPPGFPRSLRIAGSSVGGKLFSAGGCLFATSPVGLYSTCDNGATGEVAGATWKVAGTASRAADLALSYIDRLQGDAGLLVAGGADDDEPYISNDQGRTWRTVTPSMPGGMELDGIFQDGPRLWLSAGYTYSSEDGGKAWQLTSAPTGGATRYARQGGLLWAYGQYTPLAFSADSGKTWLPRDVTAPDYLGSLTSSGPVFAGGKFFTSGTFEDPGVAAGVFMSSDTGKTWVSRNQGLPPYPRSPTDSVMSGGSALFALGNVLLELTHQGIYRSVDLGAHWQAANSGIPGDAVQNGGPEAIFQYADRFYVRSLENDQVVWYMSADTARSWRTWDPGFAGLETLFFTGSTVLGFRMGPDSAIPDPIYQSKDGMKTWAPLRGPWASKPSPNPVAIYASGKHIYVAGDFVENAATGSKRNYWHSPDEGATWEPDSGLVYQDAFRWHAALKNAWFRNDGWMVDCSTDSGRTWNTCMSAGRVDASASVDQMLMVRIEDALFVTRDDGQTWLPSYVGEANAPPEAITAFGGRFFAATRLGLRVSRNGIDWEDPKETGLTTRDLRAIAASGNNLLVASYQGLYLSKDMGAQWQVLPVQQVTGSLLEPQVSWLGVWKNAFLAGIPGRGIWISSDTGQSWTQKYNAPLMGACVGPDTLIFDGGTGNIVYAPDLAPSAKTWGKLPTVGNDNPTLARADGGLYLAKAEGAFVSEAPGAAWSTVKLPGQAPHDFLAGDGKGLVASAAEGLYMRPAANMEWQPIGAGLPKDEISALSMDDGRLFAGLLSQGLWMNSALPIPIAHPPAKPLLIARPSIFHGVDGSLVFRVNLSAPARLRLTLHSAAGRTLVDQAVSARPGIQELRPNLGGRGVSFYRLEVEPEAGHGPVQTFRGTLAPFR
ncbi:MAG: hypothetical protein JF616_11575 [Fibrobacteres bacterium]|nr:hypothetical protein [Fibrobacterota bacterium]